MVYAAKHANTKEIADAFDAIKELNDKGDTGMKYTFELDDENRL